MVAIGYMFFLSLENVLHEMPLYFQAVGAITTITLLRQLLGIQKKTENRTTKYWVPSVIFVTLCTFILWNFSRPFMHVISVLLIASPMMAGVMVLTSIRSLKLRNGMIPIALAGVTLFTSGLYYHWRATSPPLESVEESLRRILPSGESIVKLEPLQGGFANYIWEVFTETNHYILREKRNIVSPRSFMRDLKISQKAFQCHLGPKVLGANTKRQQILLEYIQHTSWPFYKNDFKPYQAAMKVLRSFHEQMPVHRPIDKQTVFAPFYSIFKMRNSLMETSAEIPSHFFIAVKKIEEVFEKIHPWLQKHARLCHGDFCKANVLLSENLSPKLIDFDSAFLGDPFFDIIKFSASLPLEQRLELFQSYLEDKEPTIEELCHFKLMDLTFLMVIATLRFQSAQISSQGLEEKFSKNAMEDILNSQEPLPSWREVSFGNNSPQIKQTAALYALAEFLRRLPELESLISMVFSSEDPAHIVE
jgi:thiamine kinase-like enzyme